MKRKVTQFFMIIAVTMSMAVAMPPTQAQKNSTAKGEIKKSGSEVGNAAKGMGRNLKRGRVVRGGKHFGRHIGRAGKHFGRSTKKVVKRAIS
ncbi:MAG: hypothetical protein ABR501_13500 [Pyrinomonadaceae bacterium]